jgi:hypothetical protein
MILSSLVLGSVAEVRAQQPAPVATPTPGGPTVTLCDLVAESFSGKQVIAAGRITVQTGVSWTYSYGISTGASGNPQIRVCVREFNSDVTIDAITGREVARVMNNPAATTVLNGIVGSVRFAASPAPSPTATPPATDASPPAAPSAPQAEPSTTLQAAPRTTCISTICPPNTGSAGLR